MESRTIAAVDQRPALLRELNEKIRKITRQANSARALLMMLEWADELLEHNANRRRS